MKWEEVIRLRSTDTHRETLQSELLKLIDEGGKQGQRPIIKAYRRALVDTDFCIRVIHDSSDIDHFGSPLGLRLVSGLKAFGLVDHSIWTEIADESLR